jgi:hypothetical protein
VSGESRSGEFRASSGIDAKSVIAMKVVAWGKRLDIDLTRGLDDLKTLIDSGAPALHVKSERHLVVRDYGPYRVLLACMRAGKEKDKEERWHWHLTIVISDPVWSDREGLREIKRALEVPDSSLVASGSSGGPAYFYYEWLVSLSEIPS